MLVRLYRIFILPYTLLLLYFMLFGFGRTVMEDHIVRVRPFVSMLEFAQHNLFFGHYWIFAVNLFGNIFLFVPFGFLGWMFPKFTDFKQLLLHFLCAIVLVEAIQYFTRLGVFEVDDILLNSLGVWIGFKMKYVIERRWKLL